MLKEIPKGWGREEILVFTELYCAKRLCYDRAGGKSSMHFHKNKDETFRVEKGSFKITLINTADATEHSHVIHQGETWRLKPLTLHQLEALEDGSVMLEVSTYDSPEDNYRVRPGDSQR
jgi:quercetin dioxygenase-like cupin family protein